MSWPSLPRSAAPSPGRERGAHRRRFGRTLGSDDQAPAGRGLELVWLPDHPRRRGGQHQSRPPGHRHSSEPPSGRSGAATGARRAPAAKDPRPRRDRRAHGSVAHRAGPGHDPGHGAGRPATLRGARSSPGRSASRRVAGVDQRRQGWPRASRAALSHLLRHGGALHGPRAARDDERRALRRAERSTPRPTALGAGIATDHPGCTRPGGTVPRHLPRTASHLLHPAARGGHGHRSHPGPGRTPLHHLDPGLSPPQRRLARRRVPPGRAKPSRPRRSSGWPNERTRTFAASPSASPGRRDARSHLGRDRRQGTGHGGHHGLLPGPTRSLGPTGHRGGRRADAPVLRPSGESEPIRAARRWRASDGPTSRTSRAG